MIAGWSLLRISFLNQQAPGQGGGIQKFKCREQVEVRPDDGSEDHGDTQGSVHNDGHNDKWLTATILHVHKDGTLTVQYSAGTTCFFVERDSVLHPYDVRVTRQRIYEASIHAAKSYAGCRVSYTTRKAQMLSADVLNCFAEFCTFSEAVNLLRQVCVEAFILHCLIYPLPSSLPMRYL